MRKEVTQKQKDRWQKIREKGVKKYQARIKAKVLVPKKSPVFKSKPKKVYKINPRTKKRAADERIYNARVKILKSDPENKCIARLEGCTGDYSHNHHAKGRIGKMLLEEKYWRFLCGNCHRMIELSPDMAKEFGYSLLRLAK